MSAVRQWWGTQRGSAKTIVTIVGTVVALGILGSLAGCGKSATTTTTAAVAAVTPATSATAETVLPATTTTKAATTTTEGSTATTTKGPQWVKVASLSGSAEKTGDVFALTGAPARLSYKVEGETVYTAIYVMADGTNFSTDGGIPEVTVSKVAQDSTRLVKDAGRYYLMVKAMSPYDVTVEEQR